LYAPFTPFHRGGSGPPLVCLHGFMDTWRSWELVLPALERHHDVLALTLAGHAGGPPLEGEPGAAALVEAVEREMDAAGVPLAHIAGSSLGGYVALRLAAGGRALSVVAFAPAGGWAPGDPTRRDLLELQHRLHRQARALAPRADAILATDQGRRRATELLSVNFDHIPTELLADQLLAVASCPAAPALIEHALGDVWTLDAEAIACPVRIVWGTADRLLPWPRAAARFRDEWLPHADWVVLDGVGHYPQFDVPVEAAQLILGFTGG
jgi:pimeloyl-ACP methyl ester carboxylesterase